MLGGGGDSIGFLKALSVEMRTKKNEFLQLKAEHLKITLKLLHTP